ncbi:MAG: recombination protein RecA [Candidatus Binatota bacterium]|jgi:hypothetical protein|nr:recombination protein RecA [Candidatus Binatota bacterium]
MVPAERAPLLHLPGVTRGLTIERGSEALSSGNPGLDRLTGGGFPRGRLSEVSGPASSGRTSLLYSLLATATGRGEVVALVDPRDRFHPACAAAAGVELARVLWVRPREAPQALRAAEILLSTRGFGAVILDLADGLAPALSLRFGVAWPRLAHRAATSRGALIVLSDRRMVDGSAHLCLALSEPRMIWPTHRLRARLFGGIESRARVVRTRRGAPGEAARLRLAEA